MPLQACEANFYSETQKNWYRLTVCRWNLLNVIHSRTACCRSQMSLHLLRSWIWSGEPKSVKVQRCHEAAQTIGNNPTKHSLNSENIRKLVNTAILVTSLEVRHKTHCLMQCMEDLNSAAMHDVSRQTDASNTQIWMPKLAFPMEEWNGQLSKKKAKC